MQHEFDFPDVFVRIFDFLEKTSTDRGLFWNKIEELNNYRGRYKFMTDKKIFSTLTEIVFFSGMKARNVEKKLPAIREKLGDPDITSKYGEGDIKRLVENESIIRHERKIRACVENAKRFKRIVKKYGSFSNYLDSFRVDVEDFNGIKKKLVPALKNFSYLNNVTVYHFLMDLGFGVMKPDRTICRLFYRLGWIENIGDEEKVIEICRNISRKTGYWIRVVDNFRIFLSRRGNANAWNKRWCV